MLASYEKVHYYLIDSESGLFVLSFTCTHLSWNHARDLVPDCATILFPDICVS